MERRSDLIMKRTGQGRELAVLILENQTTVDYGMPARVFLEEALAYEKQVHRIKRRNRELHKPMQVRWRSTGGRRRQ